MISTDELWHREVNNVIEIGFTKSFLDQLDQCWNILPSHNEVFKVKSPLLTIETNEKMFSILSPIAGYLRHYSDKAQNFPDKLVESDVVISLTKEATARTSVNLGLDVPTSFEQAVGRLQASRNSPRLPTGQRSPGVAIPSVLFEEEAES